MLSGARPPRAPEGTLQPPEPERSLTLLTSTVAHTWLQLTSALLPAPEKLPLCRDPNKPCALMQPHLQCLSHQADDALCVAERAGHELLALKRQIIRRMCGTQPWISAGAQSCRVLRPDTKTGLTVEPSPEPLSVGQRGTSLRPRVRWMKDLWCLEARRGHGGRSGQSLRASRKPHVLGSRGGACGSAGSAVPSNDKRGQER